MRAWPGDDTVAHLIFVDHHQVPTSNDLIAAVEHAGRRGARAIRTSALFPDATRVVLAEGFTPIDRLALLQIDLDRWTMPERGRPTRAMRAWHLAPCSRIDREAFGLMWGNTPASLRDVRRATPSHRSRIVRDDGALAGFAISGTASDTGYVQRLAVSPEHRRRGVARVLVDDALAWMSRRGARSAFVNTGVANEAALSLYVATGFVRLADELTIAERKLV